jgi:hypothetical protein
MRLRAVALPEAKRSPLGYSSAGTAPRRPAPDASVSTITPTRWPHLALTRATAYDTHMRIKALFCIGALSSVFYLGACGSDEGNPSQDAAPSEKKDAPLLPDSAEVQAQEPEVIADVAPPDAPLLPDVPQTPDAPPTEARLLDTALTETGLVDSGLDGTPLRLDGDKMDANPADKPQIDSAVSEAGVTEGGTLPLLFTSSPCKKSAAASTTATAGTGLKVIDNQAGLEGLECMAWQRGSADLQMDLFNFDGACGADWTGSAGVDNGRVNLFIDNPSCMIASCGICMYDWSFTLGWAAIPANQSVPVSIQVSACPGSSTSTTTTSIGAEKSGIHCTLAHYGALAWHASAKNLCGKAGMPCVGSSLCGSGSSSSTGTCDAGLVCDSSAAANEPRCLVPCQKDTDCPRTDVWSCTSGLCRPKAY